MSRLLERLRRHKDDRGMMANLRCVYVESKRHRAWPALHRMEVAVNDAVSAFVAALYATHPLETVRGNFGDTCRAIEKSRDDRRSDDAKLTPTERRFQHLLSAEKGAELHGRVLRMVFMAKAQEVPVNYEKLQTDLRSWTDRTRNEWASAFWTPGVSPDGEGI